jgi:ribosome modulation factor
MINEIVLLSLQNEFVHSINIDRQRGRTDIELSPVLGIEEIANHLIATACSLVGSGAAGAFQEILTAKEPDFEIRAIDKMTANPPKRTSLPKEPDDALHSLSSFHDFGLFIERASHASIRDAVRSSLNYCQAAIDDPEGYMPEALHKKIVDRKRQLRAFLEIFDLLKQPQPGFSIEDRTAQRDRMTQVDVSAWSKGKVAGESGLAIDQCPYLPETINYDEWLKGWKKAMEPVPRREG